MRKKESLAPEQQRELLATLLKNKSAKVRIMTASFAQRRLWFLDQLVPGKAYYNLPVVLRLKGFLDLEILKRCFNELVARHEALRTTFAARQDEPVQVIHPPSEVPLSVDDLTHLEPEATELESRRLAELEVGTPFDLTTGPLIRIKLQRLSADEYLLLLTMHHIVTDGWSNRILLRELAALHRAYTLGEPVTLEDLPIQYADFAVWQQEWLRGDELKNQLAYWKQRLGDLPTLQLPTDKPRPIVQTFNGALALRELPGGLAEGLQKLSKQFGASLFMTLLAGFGVLLQRYSGQDDIVVGSPIANRNRVELEGLVGFFVNSLVMRMDASGNPSCEQLIQRVQDTALGAYEHQDLPFEKLIEELQPERDPGRNPLFQVMFVLQNTPSTNLELKELSLQAVEPMIQISRFDLEFHAWEGANSLNLGVVYNTDLFEAATIERMLRHYQALLEGVAADPSRRISELPMLSAGEWHQLVEWNRTAADYPRDKTVHELFERQAMANPDAVAIEHDGETLSYRELNQRANRLAHYLTATGVKQDAAVTVLMERTPDLVIAQLAVLKAGAAYVAIDPGSPVQRLAFILEDTRSPVLLTQTSLSEKAQGYPGRILCLDSDADILSEQSNQNPAVAVTAKNLVYVIYTSGSTGTPKGVEVPHGGLMNLVSWHRRAYEVSPADRATHLAGLGFDASVWELWPYLTSGASLYLVSDERRLEPANLWSWMAVQGITLSFLPTPLAEAVLREPVPDDLKLRVLLTGGDRLHGGLVNKPLPFRVVNHYGPTENSVVATCAEVDVCAREDPPIGRPIDNVQTYILDKDLQPVPVGVWGELCIGGDGLARGYLNQPELTAEKFIPNPFSEAAAARLYRSGDLVRYREDGQIEFRGRVDNQVKVRGFRIELGEIETVLGRHEAVQDAVVLMHEDEAEEKRLVAYVVPETGSVPTLETLHQHVRSALPEYMLPSAFVFLEELPLTPNGKVDRAALPVPDDLWVNPGAEYTAPRNELEQQLAQIWAKVLKLDRVGIHDNFFNLGGHSLLATRVVVKINEAFESNLSLARFMILATVESLAADIEQSKQAAAIDTKPLQARVDLTRDGATFPMSYAQERLWYIHTLYPDVGAAYNVSFQMQLDTGLAKIEAILQRLQQQHAILRTTYIEQGAQPVQKVNQTQKLSLHVVDVSDFNEEEIQQELFKQARILFDIDTGPIWRSTIVKRDDLALAISIAFHHIAFDGISMNLLKQEISRLCQQDTIETDLSGIEPGIQYIDYALWQRDYLDASRLEFLQTYWKRKLSGIPSVMDLPLDNPRPTTFSYSGGYEYVALSVAQSNDLRRFAKGNNVSLYMLMLAIFKLLLSRYTQQSDIVVGTPVSGRTLPEMDDIIGLFVNSVVLRTDLKGGQAFTALLKNVRETALEAFEHQELPFEKIVEIMQPEHDPSHNPIFQVMFSYFVQEDDANINAKQEPEAISEESASGDGIGSHVDLTLSVQDARGRLFICFSYNNDLFEAPTIHQMMTHYRRLLEVAIAAPETRIDRFELLGDEEKQLVLYRWNETQSDFVRNETLTSLFEQQVRRTPQAIALRYEQVSLDYSQLDQRATAVAGLLVAKSVMPGQFVGVYMERSIDFVVTIFGILKAGAAYIPLDPDYPQERINYIVSDSGVRILLSQKKFENELSSYTSEIFYLDSGESYDDIVQGSLPAVSEDMLAYVIYTSGSTGNPKGVMISHAAVVNHAFWMHSLHDYGHNDRILQKASPSFDVSVYEIFTPLLHGACVVLADPSRDKDIDYLIQTIRQEQITVLAIVPSALRMLVDRLNYADWLGSLRLIECGGEAMTLDLMRAFYEKLTAPLYNFYGPTETTIDATSFLCEADFDDNNIPIGRPGSNTRAYILDTQLQPVPIGVRGELHIAGVQLANGYLNQKQLTGERFITDPFAGDSQQRMYKTGDLARYRRDGAIEYCGRIDNQVKLRGNRIELGEIESILLDHEKIDEAAVIVREDEPGDQRLVAYLVPENGAAAEAALPLNEVIYDYLKQKLPAFMVPSRIEWMEAFPLSPSGKINYNEFPRPSHARKHTKISNNKPESEMEIIIAKIWEELLDIDDIETSDMFFDLGGHSLLTLKVVDRFARETNIRIPPASLITQTLRQLATAAETSAMVSEKGSGNGVLGKIKRKLTRRK